MHRARIERASSTHRAAWMHRADTMRHRAGEIVRPSSTFLENSISASCFLPIKKERPQECRSGYVVEGVLKAKPQTRHRAWLMCNERTLIERRPSRDRAENERRLSTDGISFERVDNRAFRAARYVT